MPSFYHCATTADWISNQKNKNCALITVPMLLELQLKILLEDNKSRLESDLRREIACEAVGPGSTL